MNNKYCATIWTGEFSVRVTESAVAENKIYYKNGCIIIIIIIVVMIMH